jgi:hypothetical protein
MCRYVNRPALSMSRLSEAPDGRVRLELKTRWSDGTTAQELTPMALAERLVAVIPPARSNQVLYHRVLGARSAWGAEILPRERELAPPRRSRKLRKKPRGTSRWVS